MNTVLAHIIKEVSMASTPTDPRPKMHHGQMYWHVHWYDDTKKRRDKWFGKCADVPERHAKAARNLWLAKWHTEDRVKNPQATAYTYSAKDLAIDYLAHARKTFVKHGRNTSHVWEVAYAMQAYLDAFGESPASDVTAPELARLRDSMIQAERNGAKYTRCVKTINGRLTIIKQAYRWAREAGNVTREAVVDVSIVSPLKAGRCAAKPSQAVKPVDEHWMTTTRDKCPSTLKAMIDAQWLTGMRPGEVCIMRACDIDTNGEVWLYTPAEHKMEHKGRKRIIPLGPRVQAVIKPFLNRPTDAYLFSPVEAQQERIDERRKNRKPQKFPSWYRKPVAVVSAKWGDHYSEESYRKAIHHACDLAYPPTVHKTAKELKLMTEKERKAYRVAVKAWHDEHRWNPNQLRHAAATKFNRQFGIEDVSVTLGHGDVATTRRYAEPDVSRAVEIARKVG